MFIDHGAVLEKNIKECDEMLPEIESQYSDSQVLRSPSESFDSDGVSVRDAKYSQFDESNNLKNPESKLFLEAIDHIQFREALRHQEENTVKKNVMDKC